MNKFYFTVVFSLGFVATAHAAPAEKFESETNVEKSADGSVEAESSVKSTDAKGTVRKSNLEQTARSDAAGNVKVETKSTTSNDPKGAMNKTWSERKITSKTDARGNLQREVTTNGVDAQGTSHQIDVERKVKFNSDGSTNAKLTEERVTDPKGLMNKQKTTVESSVSRDAQGNITKNTKKINGETVKD